MPTGASIGGSSFRQSGRSSSSARGSTTAPESEWFPGADAFSRLLPAALFADALPFALWALFAADVLAGLLRRGGAGPPR